MGKANEHLLEEIRKIKSSHPAWGYRRVWAYLRFRKDKWVKDYNEDFPHMSLGYMTPYAYEQWFKAASVA